MSDAPLAVDVRLKYADFSLDVRHEFSLRGVTGLFGPSGSGKSTLLRIICGLERRARGVVQAGDECWQDSVRHRFLPAHRRPAGYVFQDARLFAHLNVAGNLEFASSRAGGPRAATEEVTDAFDVGPLLHRRVQTLSGGERQRVAIARTLLSRPRLLLLDEPLAALDARRKADILPYLEKLPRRFGVPVIYVSHALDEVARLAEQVVVMEDGHVTASGDATEVLSAQAAELPFEAASILEARVVEHLDAMHLTRLAVGGQSIVVPERLQNAVGAKVRLHVRAGDVALATQKPLGLSIRNVLQGTIVDLDCEPATAFARATVDLGGSLLRVRLTRHAVAELRLEPGMTVFALLKTAAFAQRDAANA